MDVTVLRGPDGTPHHAVLDWQAYEALRRAAATTGGGAPPDAVLRRQREGASPVRAWREHVGLSQAQLAALVGISRAYLTQIETGERTGTIEVMARLARILGCSIERLIRADADDFAAKVARLARMPADVREHMAAVPRTAWTTRPADGSFSLVEQVCHLRDIDADGYRVRIARIRSEDAPALPDLDGEALAQERRYQEQDLQRAYAAFVDARAAIVEQLRGLAPEQRARSGVMESVGTITIDGVVDAMIAHDSGHLEELAALAAAFQGNAG
jgi:transcriptional regulator with XRE-family HTH domain